LIEKLSEVIGKIITKITVFLLIILLATIFVDVFSRSILSKPILWTQEIALISFIWSVFLGAAIGVKEKSHFTLNIFRKVSNKTEIFFEFLTGISILFFSIYLLKEGLTLTIMGLKRFSRPSGIPMVYIFLALPISGASMILFSINNIMVSISKRGNKRR